MSNKPLTYKDAGVDIDAGSDLVERIKPLVKRTMRPEVLAGLGGFGGLFALPPGRYHEPVLVSGTDGVGTKLMLAQQLNRHDTIGIDLVAMCVNDILVQGAEPLFFLDYFACGELDVDTAANVMSVALPKDVRKPVLRSSVAKPRRCPICMPAGEYDLAGFCVGAVERKDMIDGSTIAAGDVLLGLASSGPHSNGYSLIRKVLERAPDAAISMASVPARRLLTPTRIYVRSILALMQTVRIKGLAHITGGGISENLPRILPHGLHAEVDTSSWQPAAVFDWLADIGNVQVAEMRRTFNCGIGMVIVVDGADVATALSALQDAGENAWQLGRIAAGESAVRYL